MPRKGLEALGMRCRGGDARLVTPDFSMTPVPQHSLSKPEMHRRIRTVRSSHDGNLSKTLECSKFMCT